MVVRTRTGHIDYPLFILTAILLIAGLFILASASFAISKERFGTPYFYLNHQLMNGIAVGLVFLFIASRIKYKYWKALAMPLFILSLTLMLFVILPNFGTEYGGARRWLSIGPITFQPSELLKLSFIIYLAAWLSKRSKEISSFTLGFLPFIIMISFVGFFLLMEPDIGTLGILSITSLFLFFLGGGRLAQIGIAILLGFLLLGSMAFFQSYTFDRITTFLNPGSDPQGSGYQIRQSLIAIGSGGIFGKGFGLSQQKHLYLPEPIGDAIFAVYAEELGFIGSVTLIILFFLFLWRGMIIAIRAPDRFSQLLAAGIISLIFVQIVVNIGSFIGLLPLTGTPLPFISYGGSALAILMGEIGILLNISRYI